MIRNILKQQALHKTGSQTIKTGLRVILNSTNKRAMNASESVYELQYLNCSIQRNRHITFNKGSRNMNQGTVELISVNQHSLNTRTG